MLIDVYNGTGIQWYLKTARPFLARVVHADAVREAPRELAPSRPRAPADSSSGVSTSRVVTLSPQALPGVMERGEMKTQKKGKLTGIVPFIRNDGKMEESGKTFQPMNGADVFAGPFAATRVTNTRRLAEVAVLLVALGLAVVANKEVIGSAAFMEKYAKVIHYLAEKKSLLLSRVLTEEQRTMLFGRAIVLPESDPALSRRALAGEEGESNEVLIQAEAEEVEPTKVLPVTDAARKETEGNETKAEVKAPASGGVKGREDPFSFALAETGQAERSPALDFSLITRLRVSAIMNVNGKPSKVILRNDRKETYFASVGGTLTLVDEHKRICRIEILEIKDKAVIVCLLGDREMRFTLVE